MLVTLHRIVGLRKYSTERVGNSTLNSTGPGKYSAGGIVIVHQIVQDQASICTVGVRFSSLNSTGLASVV